VDFSHWLSELLTFHYFHLLTHFKSITNYSSLYQRFDIFFSVAYIQFNSFGNNWSGWADSTTIDTIDTVLSFIQFVVLYRYCLAITEPVLLSIGTGGELATGY